MTRWTLGSFALAVALAVPAPALAQGFMQGSSTSGFDGFLAVGIGVSSGGSLDASKTTYTGQLGGIKKNGTVGFEGDYGFVANATESASARSLIGAVLIGRAFGKARPYGSIGAGMLGSVAKFSHIIVPDSKQVETFGALAFGGGVFADLSGRWAVRGYLRIFRSFEAQEASHPDHYTFTRATVGAVLKF